MTVRQYARVVEVSRVPLGGQLGAAALAGATELQLVDASDFSEDGGWVDVEGTDYEYLTVDQDLDTMTLASPLLADAAEDALLKVWDPVAGATVSELLAQLRLDGDNFNDDPLLAEVDGPVAAQLPEGPRDEADSELVEFEHVGDTVRVVNVVREEFVYRDAEAQAALEGKNATFRQATEPTATAVGDLWFDTDDGNRPYIWDGAAWVDARDDGVNLAQSTADGLVATVENNSGVIEALDQRVIDLQATAQSLVDQTASWDGRVSTSDYEPGPEDVAQRTDGSLWLVRTRDRTNLVPNPSFEDDTAGWSAFSNCAIARTTAKFFSGAVSLSVTSSATGSAYVRTATGTAGMPVSPNLAYTVSWRSLAATVGRNMAIDLAWYDAAGALIGSIQINGVGVDNTTDWTLASVTETSPSNAAFLALYVGAQSTGAAGEVHYLDGFLVEQSEIVGRYFDGGSLDASWNGAANSSSSTLAGGRINKLFELDDSEWHEVQWSGETLQGIDASAITQGEMNGGLIADNTVAPDKLVAGTVVASEALAQGDLVHVWNDSGLFMARKASAAPGAAYEAHGFVLEAAAIGASVPVYHQGYDPFLSSLSPGPQYLSTDAGRASSTPPAKAGSLVQQVGFAPNDYTLNFSPDRPVLLV